MDETTVWISLRSLTTGSIPVGRRSRETSTLDGTRDGNHNHRESQDLFSNGYDDLYLFL
jgi:hypothetical protein